MGAGDWQKEEYGMEGLGQAWVLRGVNPQKAKGDSHLEQRPTRTGFLLSQPLPAGPSLCLPEPLCQGSGGTICACPNSGLLQKTQSR